MTDPLGSEGCFAYVSRESLQAVLDLSALLYGYAAGLASVTLAWLAAKGLR